MVCLTALVIAAIMAIAAKSAPQFSVFGINPFLSNMTNSPYDILFAGSLIVFNNTSAGLESNMNISSPNEADCPQNNSDAKSYKISGGSEVDSSTKYPWMASVLSHGFICAGSIISYTKILTAVVCTHDNEGNEIPAENVAVYVGSIAKLYVPNKYYVSSIMAPPKNSTLGFAILNLNTSLPTCLPNIKPICLSMTPAEDLSPGAIVTVMGWGRTNNESNIEGTVTVVKEANLSVTTDFECRTKRVDPDYFCAHYGNGGVCLGDYGGPVVAFQNGKYVLVGISTFPSHHGCGAQEPMFFASTTTSTFIDFAMPFQTC